MEPVIITSQPLTSSLKLVPRALFHRSRKQNHPLLPFSFTHQTNRIKAACFVSHVQVKPIPLPEDKATHSTVFLHLQNKSNPKPPALTDPFRSFHAHSPVNLFHME
ncbi:hypothetical protein Tco_1570715 [Tanacetum coccineum]